ncbi:MAG: MarR family transcriptional regulator [Gemmatimonadaceae bacterium]
MRYALQPIDIPVALDLALRGSRIFADLAAMLGISPSTAHQSVQRLLAAGLVQKSGRQNEANVPAIEEFLLHGARYAFPPHRSRRQRGVPTAHAAPILRDVLSGGVDPLVWPSARGAIVGTALEPLIPSAPELVDRAPSLYDMLALVDALRVGTARDREVAGQLLSERLMAARA